MTVKVFFIAWIFSVTTMTGFSIIWSLISGNEFREPVLLSKVLSKISVKKHSLKRFYLIGWILHFVIGIVFLASYELLWYLTGVNRTFGWALVFGSILGLLGVLGWKALFKMATFPSDFLYRKFYLHLYFAHLTFSLTALIVYLQF